MAIVESTCCICHCGSNFQPFWVNLQHFQMVETEIRNILYALG